MTQLAFSFDIEPPRAEPRAARQLPARRTHRQLGEPYCPFDAELASRTILEQLLKAGGEWVRRRALRRATGMHPQDVGPVIAGLVHDGVIEETDTLPINHPAHGFMGHTRGYRIAQEGKIHGN